MKKSRIIAAAMVSVAITGALAGCGKDEEEKEYRAENNANVCVYGPPSAFYDDSSEDAADGEEMFETSSSEEPTASQGD